MLQVELRNNTLYLTGYVNACERESRELPSPRGRFKEVVKSGTWAKALANSENVDLLFNHKEDRNLGSIKQGNLKLYEDNIGLRAEAIINDTELIEKAKNGELRGWSFKFSVNNNGDEWKDVEGKQLRYLHDIKLYEVSLLSVTPAYIATSIEARGEDSIITESRAIEEDLKLEKVENESKEERKEPQKVEFFHKNKKLDIEIQRLKFNKQVFFLCPF